MESLVALFTADALHADIAYSGGELSVTGDLLLDLSTFSATADIALKYKSIEKQVQLIYANDIIYLTLDGLKVSGSVDEILALLNVSLELPAGGEESALLEQLLSLNFGELLQVSEADDTLTILANGTKLLQTLGVEFALGNVEVNVSGATLTVNALGAQLVITAAEQFTVTTEGYINIDPTLQEVYQMLAAQAISLRGTLQLSLGEIELTAEIGNGYLGWSNGLYLYLDLVVTIGEVKQALQLSVTDKMLSLAYGGVGATVYFNELSTLEQALMAAYRRIAHTVNLAFDAAHAPLNEYAASIEELLFALQTGAEVAAWAGGFDLVSLLKELKIGAPVSEGGICTLSALGLTMELMQLPQGTELALLGGELGLTGRLSLAVAAESAPNMPKIDYLDGAGLAELMDTLAAAVATLAEQNLSLSLSGKTVAADGSAQYDFDAAISYYAGEEFPVHIDTEQTSITVRTDLYLKLELAFRNHVSAIDSVYLTIYFLDYNKDGALDFFCSLSRLGAGHEDYRPLAFYAPSSELMKLLSGGLAMLGVNVDLVNNYLIDRWLTPTTVAELRSLGASLLKTIGVGDLLEGLFGAEEGEADEEAISYLTALTSDAGGVTLRFNGAALFGTGKEDLSITLSKVEKEGGSLLAGIALGAIYDGQDRRTDVTAAIKTDPVTQDALSLEGYIDFTGIADLLTTLVHTAAHEEVISGEQETHEYVVNNNFYIDGSAALQLSVLGFIDITATVRIIAISVSLDEDGAVAFNLRLEYDGVQELNQVAINGDSTVDITIKEDMVYIKRTQTSYWETVALFFTREVEYDPPVVLYRAMPLDVFFGDILNQIGFIFNLGSLITDQFPQGEETDEESVVEDYGTAAANILSTYAYAVQGNGTQQWTLALNGSALTDGVLDDIEVAISSEEQNGMQVVRDLSVETGIQTGVSESLVSISLTADLRLRNPCGVMDEGVTDLTSDIAPIIERGMDCALAQARAEAWTDENGNRYYLEGQTAVLTYWADGAACGSQEVFYDPATRAILTTLAAPDMLEQAGYEFRWELPAALPDGNAVQGGYHAQTYTITLESDRPVAGWTFSEETGKYTWELSYRYGSELVLPMPFDDVQKVVGYLGADGNMPAAEDILADLTLSAVWEMREYTVSYVVDGSVVATQTGHYGDALTFPAAPEKEGYNFVGWNTAESTIAGDATYTAQYELKRYVVRLYSDAAIEGWEVENGRYLYYTEMTHGAVVEIFVGGSLASCYTITEEMNIALPDVGSLVWANVTIGEAGARLEAMSAPDTLVYTSTVAYTLAGGTVSYGGTNGDYTVRYSADTALLTAAELQSEGSTFVGWFIKSGDSWSEVTSVAYSGGGSTITLYAVWKEGELTLNEANPNSYARTRGSWSWRGYAYAYSGALNIASTFTLVGVPVEDMTVTTSYTHTLGSVTQTGEALSYSHTTYSPYNSVTGTVTQTYMLGDEVIQTKTVTSTKSF